MVPPSFVELPQWTMTQPVYPTPKGAQIENRLDQEHKEM